MRQLAGYAFTDPRMVTKWRGPKMAALFAILVRDDGFRHGALQVVYVGETDNLAQSNEAGDPFPKTLAEYDEWLRVGGGEQGLYISFHPMPDSREENRLAVCDILVHQLQPLCNRLREQSAIAILDGDSGANTGKVAQRRRSHG